MILSLVFSTSLIFANSVETKWADLKFKKGPELRVEVAESFIERNKGLMNRTELAENTGMLFIFETPQKLSFWMKDTFVPLSIAYLDEGRVIKEIHQMKAQSMMKRDQDLTNYPSQCRCKYALEVNQGWFKKHGIKPGDRMSFNLLKSEQAKSPKDKK